MIKVEQDVRVGDEVYVKKEFLNLLNVGDVYEVEDIVDNDFYLKNGKRFLSMNSNRFNEFFEKRIELEENDNVIDGYEEDLEWEYKTAIPVPNKVTHDSILELLENAEYEISTVFDKCTVVSCKLPNGFVITESSACISPENYDEEVGTDICMQKIEDKLWELEGYRLHNELYDAEILEMCIDCGHINECDECPFDIVYSRN